MTFFLNVIVVVIGFVGMSGQSLYGEETAPKSYPVLSGVGLSLGTENGHLIVSKVIPGSSAEKSGIELDGARLVSVLVDGNTTDLEGKTVGEAVSLIRGPVGTNVVLAVLTVGSDDAIKVTLQRLPIEIEGATNYDSFIGKQLPSVRLTPLDGSPPFELSDLSGKIVVLDIWASWCPACLPPVTKLQKIVAAHPEWAGNVEVIAVSVDADPASAKEVIEKLEWHRTKNVIASRDDLKLLNISAIPVTIVLSTDGTIANMAGSHAIQIEEAVSILNQGQASKS